MMRKWLVNEKGFTLIEVLLAVTITSSIAFVAMGLMRNSFSNYNRENSTVSEQQNLRSTISSISKVIMQGKNAFIYNNFSQLTLITTATGNGTAILIDGKYYFYLSGNIIRKRDLTLPTNNDSYDLPISNPVSKFQVSRPYYGQASVSKNVYTVYVQITDAKNKYSIDTYITPRNR